MAGNNFQLFDYSDNWKMHFSVKYLQCPQTNFSPTFLSSKLRAHSTSLINMVTVNGKQLQTRAYQCVKQGTLSSPAKRNKHYSNIRKNKQSTKFRKRVLCNFQKAKELLGAPAQICSLSSSEQINFS